LSLYTVFVAKGLYIALVTPFSWSVPSAVNLHVAALARELRRRGHLPVVVVSSDDRSDERRIRALFHRVRGQVVDLLSAYRQSGEADPLLLPTEGAGPLERKSGIPVVPLGSSFPMRLGGGVASLGLPLDITSRLEKLMLGAEFDLVHVHEPLAPSLSFTALREARSPVVATFHLTPLAVAAYELGESLVDRFFLRLDGRVVTFPAGRAMLGELYPGKYESVPAGTDIAVDLSDKADGGVPSKALPELPKGRYALYVYRGDGRRSYRALLRSLAAVFPSDVARVVVAIHKASAERWVPRTVPRRLAPRLTLVEFDSSRGLATAYAGASVTILPFLGGEWTAATAAESIVHGCPVVGPDLPMVRDFLGVTAGKATGTRGALFLPTESGSLRAAITAALGILPSSGKPVHRLGSGAYAKSQSIVSVAERLERVYEQTLAATSGRDGLAAKTPVSGYSLHVRGIGEQRPRKRLRQAVAAGLTRPDWVNADLHIHSNFSDDCATSVETILETAREIGLGAIAIADHNEIEGAFLAKELCGGDPFVIVAEEIKTAGGEVIGLFLNKAVPRGLSFDETLSLIKEQGGLVYLPHPFDGMRTTPTYRAMVDNLHRIDVIEIYNAKVALSSYNLAAERFAAKYNVVAGAGSDAHVPQALGTAMIRMPRFKDPQSFMAALWEADIIAKRKSLLYLQSLKLLQTTLDRVLPED
jgi:predicted metal-dependent phosphoesterase TrpH/glycosyltransferase involved in cell wall biosynthesis